jgi:hypothetical protein
MAPLFSLLFIAALKTDDLSGLSPEFNPPATGKGEGEGGYQVNLRMKSDRRKSSKA